MIISKTPFRISFFGGGTDYPVWFKKHGGAVLGTSIDKYCYIMLRKLPPNFKNKYRIVYKNEEFVDDINLIQHPSIRECLKYTNMDSGLEIVHWSDMPARKGMGSSSAFTVGLLNAIHRFQKKEISQSSLAKMAIDVEQNWIKENVGCQDQYLTAIGGMNFITFDKNISFYHILFNELEKYLLLFDTGLQHIASEIARQIIKDIPDHTDTLLEMTKLVYQVGEIIGKDILDFGRLLDRTWQLKKSVSKIVSSDYIDGLYSKGVEAGALGGKLLGAGQAGYMLFFVEPDKQDIVRQTLDLKEVNFKFEDWGSQIIYDGRD